MATFKAIRIDKAEKGTTAALVQFDEADLMEGDVTVRVEWSTLNYKDGLAVTGKAPVVRRFPMIAGIDFAGTVEHSSHPRWKAGDRVICNGWGLGETHLGAMPRKPASKATGWCVCPTASRRATRWRSAPPAIRRCWPCWRSSSMALSPHMVRSWSPARPAALVRLRSRSCQSSAITSSPPRGGRRRATISRTSARPR